MSVLKQNKMRKNAPTIIFEKLNEQNFKIINNTEKIAGGEFHSQSKTWRREGLRTHRGLVSDIEFKMVED